jgi:hypothetical protein
MTLRIERTFISRRVAEKLRRRGIERHHVNEAVMDALHVHKEKHGAYGLLGRDESGRKLLVIFHLRGPVAYIATARQVT